MVTFDAFGPRRRSCAYGTTFFDPPAAGAPADGDGPAGFCFSSMAARISPIGLPCFAMSMASLAMLGLRGQFGSFFRQPAILPIPQPHSQSRSLSACSAVTFCGAVRPAKLTDVTDARSASLIQPSGNSLSDLKIFAGILVPAGTLSAVFSAATSLPLPPVEPWPPVSRPTKKPTASPVMSGQMVADQAGPRDDS